MTSSRDGAPPLGADPPEASRPRVAYEALRAQRQVRADALRRVDSRLSISRGVVAASFVVVWYLIVGRDLLPEWSLGVPALAFAVLVLVHDAAVRRRERATRAVTHFDALLRRIDGDLGGLRDGSRFRDEEHPYAADLDVVGPRSLFARLSTARTEGGEATLARWLLAPAAPDVIEARHGAVAELRNATLLREDVALLGEDLRGSVRTDTLVAWGEGGPAGIPRHARAIATVFAVANVAAIVAWWWGGAPAEVMLLAFAVAGGYALRCGRAVHAVLVGLERPGRDLAVLSELVARIERERFTAPLLAALRARLDGGSLPPSRQIVRLFRVVGRLESRRNPFFAPIGALLLSTTRAAAEVESWRLEVGPRLRGWIDAVGELEALLSIAGYAYEQPDDVYPEVVGGEPFVDAQGLAHPLLPASAIRNDVRLDSVCRLLVVSGSNMSGKSTLLRSLGTNVVLALAGAPVRAHAFRLTPLSIGASISTHDSLEAGISRFYAEIRRVKHVVDLAGQGPTLFLLDELLAGTNSADRQAGADAVVRELATRGALGLVTTHDLALAAVADALGPAARNVHFQDHLEDGALRFDYRMRDGVVTRSNALALMRAVGLTV